MTYAVYTMNEVSGDDALHPVLEESGSQLIVERQKRQTMKTLRRNVVAANSTLRDAAMGEGAKIVFVEVDELEAEPVRARQEVRFD